MFMKYLKNGFATKDSGEYVYVRNSAASMLLYTLT